MTINIQPQYTAPQALIISLTLRLALQKSGVRFCHWKSNDHLAAGLAGMTDLDLFVAPDDQATFTLVLLELNALKMISQPWGRYPNVEDWLLFDETTGDLIHLHVHYALMTGLKRVKHLPIPWHNVLLTQLRHDKMSGWPIPSAELELLMLLVRIWAKMPPARRIINPKIPAHIAKEFNWLRESSKAEELTRLAKQLGMQTEPASLVKLINDDHLSAEDILSVAKSLNRELKHNHRMPWLQALARAAMLNLQYASAKLRRRLGFKAVVGKTLAGGGCMIAFVGSDGSGKTTVTREVQKWLRYKLDTHYLYMGSGSGGTGFFNFLRRKIKGASKPAPFAKSQKSKQQAAPGFFKKLTKLPQLALMYNKLLLLRRGRQLTKIGSIVIADRYPQSQFNGINDGPKLQEGRGFAWAADAEIKLYDEASNLGPDLVVKLLVEPKIAYQRKPDHDLSMIERKCQIIDQLVFPKSTAIPIDATKRYDEVLLSVKRVVWLTITEYQNGNRPNKSPTTGS